jgi:hypothetical protein
MRTGHQESERVSLILVVGWFSTFDFALAVGGFFMVLTACVTLLLLARSSARRWEGVRRPAMAGAEAGQTTGTGTVARAASTKPAP